MLYQPAYLAAEGRNMHNRLNHFSSILRSQLAEMQSFSGRRPQYTERSELRPQVAHKNINESSDRIIRGRRPQSSNHRSKNSESEENILATVGRQAHTQIVNPRPQAAIVNTLATAGRQSHTKIIKPRPQAAIVIRSRPQAAIVVKSRPQAVIFVNRGRRPPSASNRGRRPQFRRLAIDGFDGINSNPVIRHERGQSIKIVISLFIAETVCFEEVVAA